MPGSVAVDGSGNLFVAALGNGSGGGAAGLYEVLAAGGYTTVNQLASGTFYAPVGVAVDGSGNLFVADKGDGAGSHHAGVYEILAAGAYTTVNPLASGAFYAPAGVAVDKSGNVFVADYGNGAGGSHAGFYEIAGTTVTQLAASTGFQAPDGIAVDASGNIFVADYGNGAGGSHAGFYEIAGATVTQLAASTGFQAPGGIAVDANGNIFVADKSQATVNEVLAAGGYTTVNSLGSGFSSPMGVAVDWGDNVYIADSANGRIVELELAAANLGTVKVGSSSSTPVLVTFTFNSSVHLDSKTPYKVLTQGVTGLDFTATSGSTGSCSGNYGNGNSCTVSVTFSPRFSGTRYGAVVLNGSSGPVAAANLYGTGVAPQLAFGPGKQSLVASGINRPWTVTVDAGGNIFVPSNQDGTVNKITLSSGSYSAPASIISGLVSPMGVALDGSGNIFVADSSLGINKEAPSKGTYIQTEIAGLSGLVGIAVDQYGNLYATDSTAGSVYKETLLNGSYVQTTIGTGFINPAGIVVDGNGNVFVTEYGRGTVDELTPFNGSYTQTTVDSGFSNPEGIAVDASGSLYISSTATSILYKETPTSNGSYARSAIAANISPQPWWTTVDASGNLYFTANNSAPSDGVYKIDAVNAPMLSFPTPTAQGSPDSTDSPETATLWNIGNANLTFPVPSTDNSNPGFSSNSAFSLDSSTTCPNLSSSSAQETEAPGESCIYAVDFTPNMLGVNSGTLTLTDNNLNSADASQSIGLSGTTSPLAAILTSPTPGNSLTGSTVTFTWSAGTGATAYTLHLGTTPGTADLYDSGTTSATSSIATGLPTAGTLLYATLSSEISGVWQSNSYTYTEAPPTTPTVSAWPTASAITEGQTLASSTLAGGTASVPGTFTWATSSTVPAAGTTSESVTFTPTDSTNYTTTTQAVPLSVNQRAAATPTFSPAPGTYTSTQTVTIADKTPRATIYYTTDGSTPTTSSTQYKSAISVSSTETINAIAVAPKYSQSAVASATYTISLAAAATPTFSPAGGTYTSTQTVSIADSTTGAAIHYTTNGTTPTTSSTVYSGPITVSSTETLEAIAVATGYSQSAVASATYTINLQAATPTFSPAGGTYTATQTVSIADSTTGAAIYYTTNGTTPTTSSTVYSGPITVSSTETLQAIAVATGYSQSAVASATYTINLAAAATPTFSPAGGTYTSTQTVSIADSTTGATIHYTTNGTTPTTSSTVYSGPITVSATETLEAIAVATGYSQSAVASATYTINLAAAATPIFSPAGGTYTSTQTVSIADSTTGAAIYYTTNGSTPTTSSTVYSGPITVSATETLEAIAVATGYSQSAVASATYTINLAAAATPTFSPASPYSGVAATVTISDSTSGATIYYCQDTTNTCTPSTVGSSVSFSSTGYIRAQAALTGYAPSAIASWSGTYNPQTSAVIDAAVTPCTGAATSGTSVTCALSNLASGDLVVCPYAFDTGSQSYEASISDSANGNYLNAGENIMAGGGWSYSGYGAFGIAYKENVAAGSDTVTMTVSHSTDVISLGCSAYKNARTTASLDGAFWLWTSQASSTANPTAGAATPPTGDGELVFGNLVPTSLTPTAGANYTLNSQITSGLNLMFPEYWPQTTATPTNCPYVEAAGTWDDMCIAFLPASASAGVTPFQGIYTDFSGVTSGSVPTVAMLNSSTYNSVLYKWYGPSISKGPLTATSASGPTNALINPVWAGGSLHSGSGGLNLHYATGTGGDYISLAVAGTPTQGWLRYDFQTSIPQNDTRNDWYDQPSVVFNVSGASAGFNPTILANGSALYAQLECYNSVTSKTTYSTGQGSVVTLPYAGAIPISTNTQYTFMVSGSSATGSGTLSVYDSSGAQVGSTVGCSVGAFTPIGMWAALGVPGSEIESSGHDFWWRNIEFSATQVPTL